MKTLTVVTSALSLHQIQAGTHSINYAAQNFGIESLISNAQNSYNQISENASEQQNLNHQDAPNSNDLATVKVPKIGTGRSWTSIGAITTALDQRGCWCNFQPQNVYKGRGQPIDSWDRACKDLTNSYFCIQQELLEIGVQCEPWNTDYNYPGMGNQDTNSGTPNFSIATDDVVKSCREHNLGADECAIKSCFVEMYFSQQLSKIMFTNSADLVKLYDFKHEDGFDVELECPHQINNKSIQTKCCGIYPVRFPYKDNGERKCCGNTVYSQTIHQCCDAKSSRIGITC